jgi:PAS domain S-box-containing protein
VTDLPDSVITMELDGIVKTVNKATERILGISSEDLLSKHISTLSPYFSKRTIS